MASSPSATAPLAIVQWTHTLVMKPMLLRAREQILRSSFAEHHVVLSSCGNSEPCSTLLQKAKPLVENVTCTNAADVANALQAFSTVRRVFKGRYNGLDMDGPENGPAPPSPASPPSRAPPAPGVHPLDVGQRGWCWHSCDAPYLLWYSRTGRTLQHVRFFWFLEWDVVWTGDVTTVLSAWSALYEPFDNKTRVDVVNPSRFVSQANMTDVYYGRRLHSHDLLCPAPAWAPRNWVHRHKRNETLVPHTHVHRCVTEVYRVTHRLLGAMLNFSQEPEAAMFCEMRASSVCAMHSWCTMRSLFDRDRLHLFHTAKRQRQLIADLGASAAAPSLKEIHWARSRWVSSYDRSKGSVPDDALQRLDRPMLFHAYKWLQPKNLPTSPQVPSFAHRLLELTRPFAERLSNGTLQQRHDTRDTR